MQSFDASKGAKVEGTGKPQLELLKDINGAFRPGTSPMPDVLTLHSASSLHIKWTLNYCGKTSGFEPVQVLVSISEDPVPVVRVFHLSKIGLTIGLCFQVYIRSFNGTENMCIYSLSGFRLPVPACEAHRCKASASCGPDQPVVIEICMQVFWHVSWGFQELGRQPSWTSCVQERQVVLSLTNLGQLPCSTIGLEIWKVLNSLPHRHALIRQIVCLWLLNLVSKVLALRSVHDRFLLIWVIHNPILSCCCSPVNGLQVASELVDNHSPSAGGHVRGEIFVDGHPMVPETFNRISGYVEQDDIHSPALTVRESLKHSAQMRLMDTSKDQLNEFVDEVGSQTLVLCFPGPLHALPATSITYMLAQRLKSDSMDGFKNGESARFTLGNLCFQFLFDSVYRTCHALTRGVWVSHVRYDSIQRNTPWTATLLLHSA